MSVTTPASTSVTKCQADATSPRSPSSAALSDCASLKTALTDGDSVNDSTLLLLSSPGSSTCSPTEIKTQWLPLKATGTPVVDLPTYIQSKQGFGVPSSPPSTPSIAAAQTQSSRSDEFAIPKPVMQKDEQRNESETDSHDVMILEVIREALYKARQEGREEVLVGGVSLPVNNQPTWEAEPLGSVPTEQESTPELLVPDDFIESILELTSAIDGVGGSPAIQQVGQAAFRALLNLALDYSTNGSNLDAPRLYDIITSPASTADPSTQDFQSGYLLDPSSTQPTTLPGASSEVENRLSVLESRARIDDLERSHSRQIDRCDKLELDQEASRKKEIAMEERLVKLENLLETKVGLSADRWKETEDKLELLRKGLQEVKSEIKQPKVDQFGAAVPEQEPVARTTTQRRSTANFNGYGMKCYSPADQRKHALEKEAQAKYERNREKDVFVKFGGTFFLFAASILLLVSTITSPVTTDLSLLKVTLTNRSTIRQSSVTFGVFGHCVLDVGTSDGTDKDQCSPKTIGYDIAGVVAATTRTTYNSSSLQRLTKALILHPIATGVTFISFTIAAVSHRLGFLFSALVATVAFFLVLVTLILDFVIFGAVKNHVNGSMGNGASAAYSTGIWVTIAAFVCIFIGGISTCFSCFTDRRRIRNGNYKY